MGFAQHINYPGGTTTLGSAYTAASGSFVLATGTGAAFMAGLTPTATNPVRFTVASASGPSTCTHYSCTGRTSDTLTGVTVLSGTDRGYAAGASVYGSLYAEDLRDIEAAATPGGSTGQVQFNDAGSFAGFSGTAAVSDTNGLTDAVAIGSGSWALGEQSFAQGYQCIASTDQSVAMGYRCVAGDPPRACAISGITVTIPGGDYGGWFYGGDPGALVLSRLSGGTGPTIAYGSIDGGAPGGGVVFDGTNTVLTLVAGVTTHTAGSANMRDDDTYSHAEGDSTTASGYVAHAEGFLATASGSITHAEGQATTASGTAAHAEGIATTARNAAVHAEGFSTTASGTAAHAEGQSTTASGFYAHAEGESTTASGQASHAEGESTIASGQAAHAEGSSSVASGNFSHAQNGSTASGVNSHAEGLDSAASGPISHAGGQNAIADLQSKVAHSDGGFVALTGNRGDGQYTDLPLSALTSNGTPAANLLIVGGGGGGLFPAIRANFTYAYTLTIAARQRDNGTNSAMFIRQFMMSNEGGVAALLGAVGTIGADINAPGWSVAVTADVANLCPQIQVTADPGGTYPATAVFWQARLSAIEIGS